MSWSRCESCDMGWVLVPNGRPSDRDDWEKCEECDGSGYVGDNPPPGPECPPSRRPPDRRMYS